MQKYKEYLNWQKKIKKKSILADTPLKIALHCIRELEYSRTKSNKLTERNFRFGILLVGHMETVNQIGVESVSIHDQFVARQFFKVGSINSFLAILSELSSRLPCETRAHSGLCNRVTNGKMSSILQKR